MSLAATTAAEGGLGDGGGGFTASGCPATGREGVVGFGVGLLVGVLLAGTVRKNEA